MNHRVILYGKAGCQLCEIVQQLLMGLRREFEFTFEHVDIAADPVLLKRYREKIPVVVIDDHQTFSAPIHLADLRAALHGQAHSHGAGEEN